MAADAVTRSTVDDLFNYDIDSDDPFGENTTQAKPRDDKPTLSPRAAKRRAGDDADDFGLDLGLDKEVKIKKRKPNPKLDEALLLSKSGIPKLRALARDGVSKKLRLKGKGHELSDAAKLLNYFQLWLDDLYPRAKFADGLQMVEKVGHSKRMQVMRREWINESKNKALYGDEDMRGGERNGDAIGRITRPGPATTNGEGQPAGPGDDPHSDDLFFPDANKEQAGKVRDEPEDDELDALLAEHDTTTRPKQQQRPMTADSEGEDDLDALLAEAERPKPMPILKDLDTLDEEDDDLDALLVEREVESNPIVKSNQHIQDEDDAELDALMAG